MLNHAHLLIVGASGRFLAKSAILAGYQVSVIDLFGDSDTQQLCASSQRESQCAGEQKCQLPAERSGDVVSRLGASPGSATTELETASKRTTLKFENGLNQLAAVRRVTALSDLVAELPLDAVAQSHSQSSSFTVLFSGGAENYPQFFDSQLWGSAVVAGPSQSSIESLLCLRRIEDACRKHQIRMPETIRDSHTEVDVSQQWLVKRIRSGGGLQIRRWTDADPFDLKGGNYLQLEILGPTISGCYVAAETNGRTTTALLGASQQLPNSTPDDFRYCGSVGPVRLSECDQKEMERVGQCFASEFSLTGVFGIDFISSGESLFLVDINPRIPASAELMERHYRTSQNDFTIVGVHLDATLRGRIPTPISDFGEAIFSKRIVYQESKDPLLVNEALVEYFQNSPFITDIPPIGTLIHPGHPLVTVHAEAINHQALILETTKRATELQRVLAEATTSSQK